MKHAEIISYFKALNAKEQRKVVNDLLNYLTTSENNVYSTRHSELAKNGLKCPYCAHRKIVGYGSYKKGKRYKCKNCSRTFNSLTGSAVSWIHKKDLLKQYLYFMLQGYSLRKISDKMDICLKTAFDWRHKILNSMTPDRDSKIKGVIEADETFFLHSEKGNKKLNYRQPRKRGGEATKKGIIKDHVTVLTAYERKSGSSFNTVVCRGRITKKAIEKGLGKLMIKKESILCVDSHKSFEGFALDNKIEVKRIFVRKQIHVVEKMYYIQHVNNIHSNLKRWIQIFNGVATKYLQNYLNYFNMVRMLSERINQADEALERILQKNNVYIQRNKINQQFSIT